MHFLHRPFIRISTVPYVHRNMDMQMILFSVGGQRDEMQQSSGQQLATCGSKTLINDSPLCFFFFFFVEVLLLGPKKRKDKLKCESFQYAPYYYLVSGDQAITTPMICKTLFTHFILIKQLFLNDILCTYMQDIIVAS